MRRWSKLQPHPKKPKTHLKVIKYGEATDAALEIVRRHGGKVVINDSMTNAAGFYIRFPVPVQFDHPNIHEYVAQLGDDELLMSSFPGSPRLLESLYEVEHAGEEIEDAG